MLSGTEDSLRWLGEVETAAATRRAVALPKDRGTTLLSGTAALPLDARHRRGTATVPVTPTIDRLITHRIRGGQAIVMRGTIRVTAVAVTARPSTMATGRNRKCLKATSPSAFPSLLGSRISHPRRSQEAGIASAIEEVGGGTQEAAGEVAVVADLLLILPSEPY